MKQDPKWTEFAASLRNDNLYIKMPVSKAKGVLNAMTRVVTMHQIPILKPHPFMNLYKFLWSELERATNHSLFYAVTVEEAKIDIEALQVVEHEDENGFLRRFRRVLQAGLDGLPEVDWISRVNGPKPLSGSNP